MESYLKLLFHNPDALMTEFNRGYVAGIGVALGVIILLLLLRIIVFLIFRTRRCSGIIIKNKTGDVFVTKSAICALIKGLEKDFESIRIRRVSLYSRSGCHLVKVRIDFDDRNGCLAPQVTELQEKVFKILKNTFGIESVEKVFINLNDFHPSGNRAWELSSAEKNAAPVKITVPGE